MVGVPVIINHKDITDQNANNERVGVVSNVWFDEKDGWYWCDGIIWDETAQNLITNKGWSVSCSYDVKLADDAGGTENNIPYDIEFLDGVFTHLAIVDNPRYERANIVFNSKTTIVDNDKWITIHPNGEDSKGRHLLLKDGENVYEAMQRQWGISSPGQQHLFSVSKYKTDDNYKKELDAKIAELNKNIETSKRDEAFKEAKKINDEWESSDMPVSEYSAKAKRFEEKFGRSLAEVTRELRSKEASIKNYNQDQPRVPKGNSNGGQFTIKNSSLSANVQPSVKNLKEESNNIITDKHEDFNPDMKKHEVVNDKWITIKPHGKDSDDYRRIKLEDGETPKEAIERIYKKEDTTEETQAKGETQDNPLDDRKERINKLVKLADDISMFDSGSIEQREHQRLLDEIKKLGLSKEETEKAIHNLWDYHENILKYKAKAPSVYKVGPAEFNKRVGFEKSNSNYEKALNLEGERRSYIDSLKKQLKQIEKEEESQKLFKAQTEAITKGLLEYKLGDKTYFRPSKRGKTFYLLDQYTQAKYDKMKKANNNKEQDMALLNELKKLITKVENDKGEDMDKEKVENEKVDKRDIIRQIMAIAGKREDDEDVRTIAKLAEKLAYDKSEAGTADNACDDKKEDDKLENKKADNETKEDEKKYEELKKDVKKDAENKCKNSVDNAKSEFYDKMNEIFNAAMEPPKECLYVSRQSRLEAANEYFAK